MQSRIETLLNALINGETITGFKPQSRAEEYLLAAVNKSGTEGLPNPQSRLDALLYQLVEGVSSGDIDTIFYAQQLRDIIEGDITLLSIPEGLETIPREKFKDFETLEEAHLPNTLKSIGYRAFYSCGKLKKINIPDSVKEIDSEAFDGCPLEYDEEYGNCKYIGKWILKPTNNEITDVSFKDTDTVIGPYAFSTCTSLTEVNIPSNVRVGRYGFGQCDSLVKLTFPDGVKIIDDSAFYYCDNVESVNIPDSVEEIRDYAFMYCKKLKTSLPLPSGLKKIGSNAFQLNLMSGTLNIPTNVEEIGGYAFANCYEITSVTIPDGVKLNNNIFQKCTALTSVRLPSDLIKIPYGLFMNSSKLSSLTIPSGVTEIGGQAFYNCSALTSITLPEGLTTFSDTQHFYGTGITSITVPSGVSVLKSTFQYATKLVTVTIKGDITETNNAFIQCSALTNVTFEKTVKVTNNNFKFNNSSKLTVASMVNILNAIVDNSGEETQYTVYFGSTNLAKLTDEQKAIATAKNIILA